MKTRSYFAIFVYVFGANIPFWIASHVMGLLLTGIFNVEFVILGMLSFVLRRAVMVALLVIAMLLDVLRGVSSTYLLSPLEMIRSARYLFEYAPSHFGAVVAVAVCIVVISLMAALAQDSHPTRREWVYAVSMLAPFVVLCGAFDLSAGHTSVFRRDCQLGTLRLTRFPAHSIVMSELQQREFKRTHAAGARTLVPAATKTMARYERASLSTRPNAMAPNVVLILVESWGKPLAGDLEESLVRPYSDENLSEKYTMSRGTVPFYGPTVAGEARELCASAMGFGLLSAS